MRLKLKLWKELFTCAPSPLATPLPQDCHAVDGSVLSHCLPYCHYCPGLHPGQGPRNLLQESRWGPLPPPPTAHWHAAPQSSESWWSCTVTTRAIFNDPFLLEKAVKYLYQRVCSCNSIYVTSFIRLVPLSRCVVTKQLANVFQMLYLHVATAEAEILCSYRADSLLLAHMQHTMTLL